MSTPPPENRYFSEPFPSRSPPTLVRSLIGYCHDDRGGLLRKLLAPVARKIALGSGALPMDLSVGGMNLRCNFVDNYSEKKFVFTPWRYDREERQLLSRELPPDGVFVDIGANVGLYTITAGKALGSHGKVLAFEPNPMTMERLRFNVAANFDAAGPGARPEILLLDCGVADKDTEFELKVDRSNLGASSIARRNRSRVAAGTEPEAVRVRCRPLLDVLAEHGVGAVSALKIDIEGAEDVALAPYLRDAPAELLAGTIIIENSQELWSVDLHALMEQRGYRLRFRNRMNSVYALNSGS